MQHVGVDWRANPHGLQTYQWKCANKGTLSKLLNFVLGLHLGMHDIDHFLVNKVRNKLMYWSMVHSSLARRILIVNNVLMSSL
jgi:hypothetical protein